MSTYWGPHFNQTVHFLVSKLKFVVADTLSQPY